MTALRHYISGTDGTTPGIGGCPFDMDKLQRDYVDGAITPAKIIHLDGITSDISMDVMPLDAYNGQDVLDVLACSGFFETSTLSFRIPNLQKPGAARASDVWVAIPDNIVVPKLVQKLHQGAVDRIVISSLAFLDGGGDADKPRIVQAMEYTSCFIKCVDPTSYGYLTVFSFSFVKVKITQVDIKQFSASGANVETGRYVYEFDYNNSSGKKM
ncbi:MAG: hypothetical protein LBM19_01335 [Holosporales bacterium]|jgi:hypothetical protein|nr:hypothetical protein [Holosporales bacterium]